MTETTAEGVTGYLLYNPHNGKTFFRVYSDDKNTHVDYKLAAEDLKVTVLSKAVSLYTDDDDGKSRIDWSSKYLSHCR